MILQITRNGILNRNVIILFCILGFSSLKGVSQNVKTINLAEIPQRKVRKYIASRRIDQMQDFSSINASWKRNISISDFKVIENTFNLKSGLSNVWESYKHADPAKVWNGHLFNLGLVILKSTNSVVYTSNSSFPEIGIGQVYFLNLKLMKGLFHVPVAFEIINIDNNNHIMEISYIDNNKSLGKQTIQFLDNGNGGTSIVHRTYFKSESRFRDDFLYPYFHKIFIREYHRKMRRIVKAAKPSVSI